MKKVLTLTLLPLSLLLASGFLYACSKKENHVDVNESFTVPSDLVGNLWMYGTFSPTEVWDKNNSTYMGNAFEWSVAFTFDANGKYKQYFTAGGASGCGYKVFVLEEGKVTFDEAAQTFTTTVESVKNKEYNCGTIKETIKTSGFQNPKGIYKWKKGVTANGTPTIEVMPPNGNNYLPLRKL